VYTLLVRRNHGKPFISNDAVLASPDPDLTSKDARKRLSASALKLFFNIVDVWKIRDEDARMLLGGVTNGPYYEMKKKPEVRLLDTDRLQRVSYLVGIFQGAQYSSRARAC